MMISYRAVVALLLAAVSMFAPAQESPNPRETPSADPANTTPVFRRPQPLPLLDVQLTDAFWAPKLNIYRTRTIPHSWQYVSREIEDNEIAAGWKNIQRGQDTPWNQANLHKVLETCAYGLAQAPDPALDAKLDRIIAAIAGAQQPNGYVNALITVRGLTPWANLDGQHDGYVAGHLIEAAVAHHLATGKTTFLDVARRLADHIHHHFIVEDHEGVCGHAELELALVRLYWVTQEPRYLALAGDWIERRGKPWRYSTDTERSYFMDHLPVREVTSITGHAVRAMFYAAAIADVATETADTGLRDAARRLWHSTTARKMYVTGSVGSEKEHEAFGPDFHLPNDGYAESCAACGLVYFADAMFRLDAQSESIDVMERALYNAVLHGIALDGTHTYYCNPLSDKSRPRDNVWVCCPPCISRTLLRLPGYLYAQTDSDLFVNLYAANRASVRFAGASVHLNLQTDFPFDGKVRLTVEPAQNSWFRLRLRIPGWSRIPSLRVNGHTVPRPRIENGYAVIARNWQQGDSVELEFPMPVERVLAHPRVEANVGRVALQRGPLIYGFEGVDHDEDLQFTMAPQPQWRSEPRPELLGGIIVLHGVAMDGRPLTAIPFYALANRSPSSQEVWVRQSGPIPPPDPAQESLYRHWKAPASAR